MLFLINKLFLCIYKVSSEIFYCLFYRPTLRFISYRSPDDLDEFAQFARVQPQQNGGGVSPDGIEEDYQYEEDEIDFTPQNGYIADEPEAVHYQEEEEPQPAKKAPKERYVISVL